MESKTKYKRLGKTGFHTKYEIVQSKKIIFDRNHCVYYIFPSVKKRDFGDNKKIEAYK
jgi:hypothetical protein